VRRAFFWRGLALAAVLLLAVAAFAQRGGRRGFRGGGFGGGFGGGGFGQYQPSSQDIPVREADFHFIRVEYTDVMRRGFGFVSRGGRAAGWWAQDWPDAENHFTVGVQRLTRVDAGDPRHFSLTDPKLFDYPWIYLTQTGYWDLSGEEIKQLHEYLMRGGFLMTDDFWSINGTDEWDNFEQTMKQVLPNHPVTDIALSDSVMHVLYDIQQKDLTFIPGSRHVDLSTGQVYQPQGTNPRWQAINDDKGRMMVAVNFNTDIGDAWEFADVPGYPEQMTRLAYYYGVNYLIYAMTH
jgi:Domain of unknown function (DUF4159)